MSLKIVAVGEVLWDLLPAGPQLGGAPANFACHAQALAAEARLITRVGDDALGREVLARFTRRSVSTEAVQIDAGAPTGTVTVEIAEGGQPNYAIHQGVAWDRLAVTRRALDAVRACDAICFGTLGQRSGIARDAIRQLVSGAPQDSLRILDINLRAPFFDRTVVEESLGRANVLKLNDEELPLLATMLGLTRACADGWLGELRERFGLRLIALTRGSGGSVLLSEDRRSEHPGLPARVVDTIGAGDAFTAAMTLGLLLHWDLDRISARANEVAAYVCSQAGATPGLPASLTDAFRADAK